MSKETEKLIEMVVPVWETEMKIIDKIDSKIISLLVNSAINSTFKFLEKNVDYDGVKCCYIVRPDDI